MEIRETGNQSLVVRSSSRGGTSNQAGQPPSVIPAKAGIQKSLRRQAVCLCRRVGWTPACAGMTGGPLPFFAIPAMAGIHETLPRDNLWTPASAGVTAGYGYRLGGNISSGSVRRRRPNLTGSYAFGNMRIGNSDHAISAD